MTFDEHVQQHRLPDGSFDLAAAEAARAAELASSDEDITELARKAAKDERRRWEATNRERLGKQFLQPALSPELQLDVMVPLGGGVVVELGDMNHDRIQLRKDMRTWKHLAENRAFDDEMTFWLNTERLLPPGGTIGDALS